MGLNIKDIDDGSFNSLSKEAFRLLCVVWVICGIGTLSVILDKKTKEQEAYQEAIEIKNRITSDCNRLIQLNYENKSIRVPSKCFNS